MPSTPVFPLSRARSRGFVLAAVALAAAVSTSAAAAAPRADPFEVSIIHLNDFHARFEEIHPNGGTCPEDDPTVCVGGIARVVAAVNSLLEEKPDSLLLNAGDNFQGTFWFSSYGWNVTQHFLNILKWTAITLGNHEFDRKIEEAVNFIDALEAPVVVANIDDSKQPSFQGKCEKSIITDYKGRKIGIIGVITDTTKSISSPENLEFLDVAQTMATEGKKLKDAGVDIVVVLSHTGIEVDLEVAKTDPYVDIIVGGHSHTLLHNGANGDTPYAEYPIIVEQAGGARKVAVVQAGAYTRYLGDLTAYFDEKGELISAEGNTIYLDQSITPDANTLTEMEPWAEALAEQAKTVVGNTAVMLEQAECGSGECNLGNLVADAQVHAMVGKGPAGTWTRAAIGLTNSGGLRAPIAKGVITYNDLVTALPFMNTIDYMEVQGKGIKAALELAVSQARRRGTRAGPWRAYYFGFLQVSGLRVVYDVERAENDKVVCVDVLCHKCEVPIYEPLKENTWYPVAINSFLAGGGDGYRVFPDEGRNHELGVEDTEVVKNYMQTLQPITHGREGRIVFLTGKPGAATLGKTQLGVLNLIVVALAAAGKWL